MIDRYEQSADMKGEYHVEYCSSCVGKKILLYEKLIARCFKEMESLSM